MEIDNQPLKRMSLDELKASYDKSCKTLLSYKSILAQILKGCVEEYKNETPERIEGLIEGEPIISGVAVHRDEEVIPKISGINNEDSSVNEGTVYYDILFYALLPDETDKVKLIINIEAQNAFDPGYPLIKRALYYCSRLISAQKGTEFTKQNYGDIKKVISIWICTNPPKEDVNTLTRFNVAKTHLIGKAEYRFKDYDIFDVVMVCLDVKAIKKGRIETEDENFRDVIRFLTYLLASGIDSEEKGNVLKNEYGLSITDEINKEAANMCNLSDGVFREGLREGLEEGLAKGLEKGMAKGLERGKTSGTAIKAVDSVKALMKNLGWSLSEALDALNITKEEYNNYIALAGSGNA